VTRYLTDKQAQELESMRGLDPEARKQMADDAEVVYRWLESHKWGEEKDLRSHGEAIGIGPDRMNAALQLLVDTGRVTPVGEAPTPPDVGQPPDLDEMTEDELRQHAAALNIEGRSKLTNKKQLKAAIRKAERRSAG
jgi:hypothetical protein